MAALDGLAARPETDEAQATQERIKRSDSSQQAENAANGSVKGRGRTGGTGKNIAALDRCDQRCGNLAGVSNRRKSHLRFVLPQSIR